MLLPRSVEIQQEKLCFQWCETRTVLLQCCRMLPAAWRSMCKHSIKAHWLHRPCQHWAVSSKLFLLCYNWHCSTLDSYRWCFCTDKSQHPRADLLPKPLYMNNEKLSFRHPLPCSSILFLASHLPITAIISLCGLSTPVMLCVALWLLPERELPLQVVAPERQPWGVNMRLLHVVMKVASIKR